jgi:apolipoprotein N-acyltransferase
MSQSSSVLTPVRSVKSGPATFEAAARGAGHSPWSYVWLSVALLLFVVANGGWIIPIAAWISPVFLLRFLRTQRPVWGLCLASASMTCAAFVSWWGMVPAPGVLYFVIVGLVTAGALVPFAVDSLLFQRFDGLPRTLILPTALVSMEFLTAQISPYGSWGAIGYTQVGNLPLLQLVSVTGVVGIGFLVAWFAAVVNEAWDKKFEWRRIGFAVGSFGAALVIVLLAGAVRLTFFPPAGETVRVASITAPDDLRDGVNPAHLAADLHLKLDGSMPDAVWRALSRNSRTLNQYLAEQSRREARAGAKIIFWPEGQAVVPKESESELVELGRQTARGEKIHLGMGMVVVHREDQRVKIENRFVFLDPQGNTLFDYTKQMPVPGGEAASSIIPVHDFRLPVVDTPHGRIAGAICFDMDFPWFIRQAGVARADMILAPSNDWRAIDPLHTHMACMRGIELGCSVIRHTSTGLSAAVDYQGRLLAEMDHFTTPGSERVMVTHVPVHGVPTFYARFGDLFSWICVAGLLVLTVVGLVRPHAPWSSRSPNPA